MIARELVSRIYLAQKIKNKFFNKKNITLTMDSISTFQ